jgi:FMN-dependent dehydrogenase
VMIGRAYLWGLAANGQAGVENVLDILRAGIDSALLGLGKASIADLTSDDIVVPPGFTRTLGADGPVFGPALNRQRAEPVPDLRRPAPLDPARPDRDHTHVKTPQGATAAGAAGTGEPGHRADAEQ